jgi:tRNA threonylcarbamoyladenosine biosynthesis protein TsaE
MPGPAPQTRESVTFLTDSAERTRRLAAALGRAIHGDGYAPAKAGLFLSLLGDLGAGKTVFASGLLEGLGVPPSTPVTSPTFTFAKAYRGRVPVHHVDAYLVRGRGDLEASGFHEMGGNGGVVAVEWGERIVDSLPVDRLEVELTVERDDEREAGTDRRRISVRATGPASAAVLARFAREMERGA